MQKRLRRNLTYAAVRALASMSRALPRRMALATVECVARLFFHLGLDRLGKARTLRNLRRVFGSSMSERQIRRLAASVYGTLGRSAADFARIASHTEASIDRIVEARGLDKLDRAMSEGRGVIGVTGHIGNWELLAAYLALKGYGVSALSRGVYDSRLDAMLVALRRSAGIENLPRDGSAASLVAALRRGRLLGILMDQDTGVEGVFVDFLGRKAHTPLGPAALALATGAPLIPMAIHWERGYVHVVEVGDRVAVERTGDRDADLRTMTGELNRELERFILAHPEQWVWMHNRWRREPGEVGK